MNESIEKDNQEIPAKRIEYLEDQHGQVESYEYDDDAYTDDKTDGNRESPLKRPSERKNPDQRADESMGDVTGDDGVQPETDRVEIGVLYFCIYETNPNTFIRCVLWAKVADILVHLALFGLRFIWLQAFMSLVACWFCLKYHKGFTSRKYYTTLFVFMMIQQLCFSVIFVVCLVDATDKFQSYYLAFLALFFLLWLMQNIAWDFQILDNSDLLATEQEHERHMTDPGVQHKSLEDSIAKEAVPEEKQTKNKLRKRVSQQQLSEPSEDI